MIVALAVAGFALAWPLGERVRAISPWPVVGAFGVFLVFGAPVIFSGEAGFAGYIKLDDTSTWLAFTDHVLAYGHSTSGLAPSSYEATVQINLSAGYPLGTFIPLAVGRELTGTDPAWLFQPYMALMAAMMSLVFFELLRRVVPGVGARSALVFIAAQPALLVGYAYWGGVKEVATALLVALLAAAITALVRPGTSSSLRAVAPAPILAGAALIGVMGAGGAPWLLAIALAAAVLMAVVVRRASASPEPVAPAGTLVRVYLTRALVVAAGVALIGLPTVLASGSFFSPDQGPLTSGGELGNLIEALEPAQYAGPWPVGDFRVSPDSGLAHRDPDRRRRARLGLRCAGRGQGPGRGAPGLRFRHRPRLADRLRGRLALDPGQGAGHRHRLVPDPGDGRDRLAAERWRRPRGPARSPGRRPAEGPRGGTSDRSGGGAGLQRAGLPRVLALPPGPAGRARADRRAVRRPGADPDDRIPALRGASLPPAGRRRGRIGAPAPGDPAPRRFRGREGRLDRHRRARPLARPRRPSYLPDPGPPPKPAAEPPALALPAGRAGRLLRGLAAPGRVRPRLPDRARPVRRRHSTRRRSRHAR